MRVSVEPILRWEFADLGGIVSHSYQVSPSLSPIYAGLSLPRERDGRPNTTLEKTHWKDLKLFHCELSKVAWLPLILPTLRLRYNPSVTAIVKIWYWREEWWGENEIGMVKAIVKTKVSKIWSKWWTIRAEIGMRIGKVRWVKLRWW